MHDVTNAIASAKTGRDEPLMNDSDPDLEVQRLRARVASLEQLLAQQEHAIREQAARVDQSLHDLSVRAQQLANSENALREQTHILQSILDNMGDGVVVADAQGKFLLFNPAAERILHMGRTDTRPDQWSRTYGCYLPDCITLHPPEDLPLARAIRGEEVTAAVVYVRHDSLPEGAWLSTNARPLRDENGVLRGGVVVMRDTTAQYRAETRRQAQYSVTHALEEAASLDDATPRVLRALGESTSWDMGALWQFDTTIGVLRCVDVWRRPGQNLDDFEAATRRLSLGLGVDLPGQVWASGHPTWVADLRSENHSPRAASFPSAGFQSAIAFPILHSSGEVGGVIEFYGRAMTRPDDDLLAMFAALGSQIGQFIDRKNAEKELARSRERFELAVRGSGDGLWDYDVVSQETYMSPRWKEMIGYQDHEVPNLVGEWERRVHPDDRLRARMTLKDYLENPKATMYELEHRLEHKDGSYRWILARGVALRDETGRAYRIAGSHTDITTLKEMMQALRDSEALYHSLVETLPLHIFRKDLDGRFTFGNRLFCKVVGRPLSQIMGRTDHDFYPADLADKYRADDIRVAESHDQIDVVEENVRPDGSKIYVQVLKTPVYDARGEVVGIQGIFWDITDRKRGEEAILKGREAAEAANRAKSEFLANMSHEIRTPMNAIVGMTELLLDTPLSREQREYLDMVRSSADALMNIINEILDFSKIEAGKLDLDRTPFGLADLVGDTLKVLAVRAHEKGLELACRIARDVPEAIVGDPHRLRQVLVNLVGNALKFTEQGEVVVSVTRVEDEAGRVALEFAVNDTGIGIPGEKQRMIFDPFSQVDGSTTRKYGGTGLGLAICSRLVGMMGGQLQVDSEIGKGSRFHFRAPFEVAKGPPAKPAAPERLRGLPVLIVDDNATNRLILEETLMGWDMRPSVVCGGQEALEAMEEAVRIGVPYKLVLLDAQMPHMDGYTFAARLLERPDLTGGTVLMLSSSGQLGSPSRRELGITGYLTKPVKQADLWRAILDALGSAEETVRIPKPVETPRATPSSSKRLRILLAEDNPFNQKLAIGLLEKEGHQVIVANNGAEALAVLERDSFDVVLMDVQMPDMDGLEATTLLRQREAGTGRRLPVLAMTAYAMKGDRERCLEAGMDAYISKPIRARELYEAIATLTAPAATPIVTLTPEEAPDWDAALASTGGDEQLLSELVKIFLSQYPGWLEQMRRGLASADARAIKSAAHNLKSCLGNFGTRAACDAAIHLEAMGRAGNLSGAADMLHSLEDYLTRLRPTLENRIIHSP